MRFYESTHLNFLNVLFARLQGNFLCGNPLYHWCHLRWSSLGQWTEQVSRWIRLPVHQRNSRTGRLGGQRRMLPQEGLELNQHGGQPGLLKGWNSPRAAESKVERTNLLRGLEGRNWRSSILKQAEHAANTFSKSTSRVAKLMHINHIQPCTKISKIASKNNITVLLCYVLIGGYNRQNMFLLLNRDSPTAAPPPSTWTVAPS